jgi:alpha-tubulin suppressor-like RCC1 family protein
MVLAAVVTMLAMVMAAEAVATPPPNRALTWGQNLWGRLGDGVGTVHEHETFVTRPVTVCAVGTVGSCPNGPYLSEVSAVSAGGGHSLALLSDGSVVAWGENLKGQLGDGTHTGPSVCKLIGHESEQSVACSPTPVVVSGLSGVTAVAAGGSHSLALLSNGTVVAWGDNSSGQLGDGTTNNSDVPVAVSGLSGVTAISAAGAHSSALLSNGTVEAWGENKFGQLGDGTTNNSDVPVAVSGLTEVTAIADGAVHSLALLGDGTVKAWGDNGTGELGTGNTESSDVPVAVSGLSEVTAIAAGYIDSSAVLGNGTAMAWGNNDSGQLGDGSYSSHPNSDVPMAVCAVNGGPPCPPNAVLSGVAAISDGTNHTMALLGSGAVATWGRGCEGQLGIGIGVPPEGLCLIPNDFRYSPVEVGTLSAIEGISSGTEYSLAFGPPAPSVASVSPNDGPQPGGTTVTITGSNLAEATAVRFGSAEATFTVNPDGSLTAISPAGSGTVDVTVTGPTGTSSITSADRFTYIPAPSVASIKPTEGPVAGGITVTITGTNLTGASAVMFGSSKATSVTIKSATTITAKSPAGSGTVDVTVTTLGGTSATSEADQFRYVPGVTKLKPANGPTTGGTSVTITGGPFTGASAVKFGSVDAAGFTVNSSTSITAVSPPEGAAVVDVRVTTSEGITPISTKDTFRFTPTITGLSPNKGSTAGGTTVAVTGTGFVPGTSGTIFKFGTAPGTAVSCAASTECTVTAPAHAAGKIDVKAIVNKIVSPKTAADQFTYE